MLKDTAKMSMSYEAGAPAGEGFIPLCVPEVRGNEWQYIKECLDTGWVSSVGTYVERFERSLAEYVGTDYAVATVNGTAALHIALLVAGIQPDDEVLVSSLTFIAPAYAIRYAGAQPVFIDVEPAYWQMDAQRVQDFLEEECQLVKGELRNKTTGRRVKAILPVHVLGHPVDMDPIMEVARKFGLVVIEDATESLGSRYKDRSVGNLADIACFSFNGNKVITTGGGGMILTNNAAWAKKAKFLTTQAKDDPLEYVHSEIGYNYRLSNIQAAMGCAQMEQLASYLDIKRRIAATYAEAFGKLPGISLPKQADWAYSTYWIYTVLVDEARFGMNSRALLKALVNQKIQTRPLWQPLHESKAFPDAYMVGGAVAERLNRQGLSLPSSVGLSPDQQARVIQAISSLRQPRD